MKILNANELWDGYIFFKSLTGSQAYGLAHEGSDEDWRGWYAPPTYMLLGLYSPPEQLEHKETDEVYWELAKYIKLLTDNNPNVLETLWSNTIIYKDHPIAKVGKELVANRNAVLSKKLAKTFGGYAMSQWEKGERHLASSDPAVVKLGWKHLMHLCRLLISGTFALNEGELLVDVSEYRTRLLEIRRGEWEFDAFCAWRDELESDFTAAKESTMLPDECDVEYLNDLLISARSYL